MSRFTPPVTQFEPLTSNEWDGGEQHFYRLTNLDVNVARNHTTQGFDKGLWEVRVLKDGNLHGKPLEGLTDVEVSALLTSLDNGQTVETAILKILTTTRPAPDWAPDSDEWEIITGDPMRVNRKKIYRSSDTECVASVSLEQWEILGEPSGPPSIDLYVDASNAERHLTPAVARDVAAGLLKAADILDTLNGDTVPRRKGVETTSGTTLYDTGRRRSEDGAHIYSTLAHDPSDAGEAEQLPADIASSIGHLAPEQVARTAIERGLVGPSTCERFWLLKDGKFERAGLKQHYALGTRKIVMDTITRLNEAIDMMGATSTAEVTL